MLTIGIDLGSTTVKYALLSESGVLLSHDYVRHGSAVKQTLEKVLRATSNTERPIWMPPLNWAERTLSSYIYPTALNSA